MQRYVIDSAQMGEAQAVLIGEDARHISRVMRMQVGDTIIVCNGLGRQALGELTSVSGERVEAALLKELESSNEAQWRITVAQSLPKGDKMELVIQKGTEIGAAAFVPFQSARSIVTYDSKKESKRLERWARIAKEASEQAHRSKVPTVHEVQSWRELLASFAQYDLVLFCYERAGDTAAPGLRQAVASFGQKQLSQSVDAPQVLLVVGPEGGFTVAEAEQAQAAGAIIAGLGPRILRTETAALVALACLMYESGEMGGA